MFMGNSYVKSGEYVPKEYLKKEKNNAIYRKDNYTEYCGKKYAY